MPCKKGKVKCKNLSAKTVDKAIEQLYVFKNLLESNSYQTNVNIALPKQKFANQDLISSEEKETPILLTDCMALYEAYLRNIDVPEHEAKKRKEAKKQPLKK